MKKNGHAGKKQGEKSESEDDEMGATCRVEEKLFTTANGKGEWRETLSREFVFERVCGKAAGCHGIKKK